MGGSSGRTFTSIVASSLPVKGYSQGRERNRTFTQTARIQQWIYRSHLVVRFLRTRRARHNGARAAKGGPVCRFLLLALPRWQMCPWKPNSCTYMPHSPISKFVPRLFVCSTRAHLVSVRQFGVIRITIKILSLIIHPRWTAHSTRAVK